MDDTHLELLSFARSSYASYQLTTRLSLKIFNYRYENNEYKISNLVGTIRQGTDATHPFFMLYGGYLVD